MSSFAKYFAIDAAVALEAYGQTVDVASLVDQYGTISSDPNADMIRVVQWPDYITAGQSRLLASEWYKLFVGENDNRKELTWRNRLGNVPSEKVYNFYSSTEEVLRRYPDDDLLEISELLGNLDQITDYLSIATWVKQEKFKGRNYFPNVGGAMSPFGGWELNRYWWIEDPNILSDPKVMIPLPPETSVYISEDTLRETPFFDLRVDELLSENPNDTAPSDFVMKLVSDTELANYYDDNEAAHELVRVRDWLLAEAFPATTLPMGANENGKLRDHNIDMSLQAPEGFKTSDDSWPREEDGEPVWYHSDYKDIPYHHVYTFYKKIKDICEN